MSELGKGFAYWRFFHGFHRKALKESGSYDVWFQAEFLRGLESWTFTLARFQQLQNVSQT